MISKYCTGVTVKYTALKKHNTTYRQIFILTIVSVGEKGDGKPGETKFGEGT